MINLDIHQQRVVNEIETWFRNARTRKCQNFWRLSGAAGTGKTTVISYILNESKILKATGSKKIGVATYTWKAANVLKSKGVNQAVSIHRLIYRVDLDAKSIEPVFTKMSRDEIRDTYSLIIIDEATQVSPDMRKDLLSYGVPVLFVGDHHQLPAIIKDEVSGKSKDDTFMLESESKLHEIHRQAKESEIIRLSMDIRENCIYPVRDFNDLPTEIFKDSSIQIVCGLNTTRNNINQFVRTINNIDSQTMPQKGEKVIGKTNDFDRGIFNGQSWVVESDKCKNVKLEKSIRSNLELFSPEMNKKIITKSLFPDDLMSCEPHLKPYFGLSSKRMYKDMKDNKVYGLDFGYAITAHVAQGSQYENVIVIAEKFNNDVDFYKRWLYTAVTRAIDNVVIVNKFNKSRLWARLK